MPAHLVSKKAVDARKQASARPLRAGEAVARIEEIQWIREHCSPEEIAAALRADLARPQPARARAAAEAIAAYFKANGVAL